MKTTLSAAIAAVALAAGLSVGQAQAHTVIRYLPKSGIPYAVPHTHPKGEYKVRSMSDCPRTVIIRGNAKQTQYYCPVL